MRMLKASLLAPWEEAEANEVQRAPHEIAWQLISIACSSVYLGQTTAPLRLATERVMDGDIDDFIYAKLRQDASG